METIVRDGKWEILHTLNGIPMSCPSLPGHHPSESVMAYARKRAADFASMEILAEDA